MTYVYSMTFKQKFTSFQKMFEQFKLQYFRSIKALCKDYLNFRGKKIDMCNFTQNRVSKMKAGSDTAHRNVCMMMNDSGSVSV